MVRTFEERLVQHSSIARAIGAGVSHPHHAEVPTAFYLYKEGTKKPGLKDAKA